MWDYGKPPASAVVLFNGKDLRNWRTRDGQPASWDVADGIMTVKPGTGDILTEQTFVDFNLHLEFRCPYMPEATGQGRGNSGVFLQGRYEVQVLDSYGVGRPGLGDCGSIYDQHGALVNACTPPGEWQTYDVVFRAPRLDEAGQVLEGVRLTVFQNGLVVQNNVVLPGVTGAAIDENVGEAGPLLLQDHGNLVSYRNVWIAPLPLNGSDQYGPG